MYSIHLNEVRASQLNGLGDWLDDTIAVGVKLAQEWAGGNAAESGVTLPAPPSIPKINVPIPAPASPATTGYSFGKGSIALIVGGLALLTFALTRGKRGR